MSSRGAQATRIATRALRARGRGVLAVVIGEQMLRRMRGNAPSRTPARLPLRKRSAHVVCFARAWHWLDHEQAR